MSCLSRPDWAEFFDCAYDHVTEPVSIVFPFGVTYLVAVIIGGVIGWGVAYAAFRVFGYGILKPFDWLSDRIGAAVWFAQERCRRQPGAAGGARQPEAGQEGEPPEERSAGERFAAPERPFQINERRDHD